MFHLILTILAVLVLLLGNETWWRGHAVHGEFSRKFIHVTVGSFVAFWPFILSWRQIEWLSVAFLVAVGLSKYFHVFRAIHSVQRPTWGEVYFAAAVGLVALLTHNKWIYAAALLQMSLADGLAAILGIRYGRRQSYLVLGHAKSVVGTLTFFVVSVVILLGFSQWSGMVLGLGWMVGVGALVSALENLAIAGLDNLLVPLAVAVLLINR